jgi:hypothetical protein
MSEDRNAVVIGVVAEDDAEPAPAQEISRATSRQLAAARPNQQRPGAFSASQPTALLLQPRRGPTGRSS